MIISYTVIDGTLLRLRLWDFYHSLLICLISLIDITNSIKSVELLILVKINVCISLVYPFNYFKL